MINSKLYVLLVLADTFNIRQDLHIDTIDTTKIPKDLAQYWKSRKTGKIFILGIIWNPKYKRFTPIFELIGSFRKLLACLALLRIGSHKFGLFRPSRKFHTKKCVII